MIQPNLPIPEPSREDDKASEKAESFKSMLLQQFSPKLIKMILELLCDESGFLIEAKLHTLLSPLERDEQSLMKLDAIFGALGVETEDDINKLASYFVGIREKMATSASKDPTASQRQSALPGQEDQAVRIDAEISTAQCMTVASPMR